jgi:hypothetical protein
MNMLIANVDNVDASKEVGPEVNAEKLSTCWLSSCHQSAEENHDIIDKFEDVAELKYLRTRVMHQFYSGGK